MLEFREIKTLNQRYLMFLNVEFKIIFQKQFVLKKFQFWKKYFSFFLYSVGILLQTYMIFWNESVQNI